MLALWWFLFLVGGISVCGHPAPIETRDRPQGVYYEPARMSIYFGHIVRLQVGSPPQNANLLLRWDLNEIYIALPLCDVSDTCERSALATNPQTVDNERGYVGQPEVVDYITFGAVRMRAPIRLGMPAIVNSIAAESVTFQGVLGLGPESPLWQHWDEFTWTPTSLLLGGYDAATLEASSHRDIVGVPTWGLPRWMQLVANQTSAVGYQFEYRAQLDDASYARIVADCVANSVIGTSADTASDVDGAPLPENASPFRHAPTTREELLLQYLIYGEAYMATALQTCNAIPREYVILVVPHSDVTIVPDAFHNLMHTHERPSFTFRLTDVEIGRASREFLTLWTSGAEQFLPVGTPDMPDTKLWALLATLGANYTDTLVTPAMFLRAFGTHDMARHVHWCRIARDEAAHTRFLAEFEGHRAELLTLIASNRKTYQHLGAAFESAIARLEFRKCLLDTDNDANSHRMSLFDTHNDVYRTSDGSQYPVLRVGTEQNNIIILGNTFLQRTVVYHRISTGFTLLLPAHASAADFDALQIVIGVCAAILWVFWAVAVYPRLVFGLPSNVTDEAQILGIRYPRASAAVHAQLKHTLVTRSRHAAATTATTAANAYVAGIARPLQDTDIIYSPYTTRASSSSNQLPPQPPVATATAFASATPSATQQPPSEFATRESRVAYSWYLYQLLYAVLFSRPSWMYEYDTLYMLIDTSDLFAALVSFVLFMHLDTATVFTQFVGNRAFADIFLWVLMVALAASVVAIQLLAVSHERRFVCLLMQMQTLFVAWLMFVHAFNFPVVMALLLIFAHVIAIFALVAVIHTYFDMALDMTRIRFLVKRQSSTRYKNAVTITRVWSLVRTGVATFWLVFSALFLVLCNYPFLAQQLWDTHPLQGVISIFAAVIFVVPCGVYIAITEAYYPLRVLAAYIRVRAGTTKLENINDMAGLAL